MCKRSSTQAGFTIVELLVAMVIAGIVLTISVPALSHYWRLQTLNQARDSIVGHLREVQERVISESHPLVYGVRFSPGGSATSSSRQYAVLKYDPGSDLASTSDDSCIIDPGVQYTLPGGTFVQSATFSAAGSPVVIANCPTSGSGNDKFLFFYARGTATGGSITIYSPAVGETRTIQVVSLTARVDG